jgi:hypothetical protein|tara:strand:- start:10722 stop:10979 length:258 start_codon:yes stop_codon:yes gene_type:complete
MTETELQNSAQLVSKQLNLFVQEIHYLQHHVTSLTSRMKAADKAIEQLNKKLDDDICVRIQTNSAHSQNQESRISRLEYLTGPKY